MNFRFTFRQRRGRDRGQSFMRAFVPWLLFACGTGGTPGVKSPADALAAPATPPATAPGWVLEDFQPQSQRHGEAYGLSAFREHVTLVALLSGW
jgi:hypothetical protein